MSETEVPNASDLNDLQAKSIPPVMANQTVPPQMHEYPRGNLRQSPPPDETMKYLIPVNPSAWALISGYLGLFSVLLIFAPFALVTGIFGLRDIKANPNKSGIGRAWFGIIMGTVFSFFLIFWLLPVLMNKKS